MKFAIIPRGGASGLTGGAVPARKRTVMVSTTRLTAKSVNKAARTMTCQAGVITQDAIDFAASKGLLFTVDPASKTASTIGGNVSENSGGPFCFEYGTTIDNLLSWSMVTPHGRNHPHRARQSSRSQDHARRGRGLRGQGSFPAACATWCASGATKCVTRASART